MFEYQRLSKEDYAFMGNTPVWTYNGAWGLLTSFEMEVAGKFGNTDELYQISNRRIRVFNDLTEIEQGYKDIQEKWEGILTKALSGGDVPFANVPDKDSPPPEDLPEGFGSPVSGDNGTFRKDNLLAYLRNSSEVNADLDIKKLELWLSGDADAPIRNIVKVEVEKLVEVEKVVEKIVEVEKQVEVITIEKVPMSKEDMASGLASGRNPVPKAKVKDYVLGLFGQGCTCLHNHMRDHVIKHFKDTEQGDTETPDKEKVSIKLTKPVILKEVRSVYVDADRGELIFDKQSEVYQRNSCPVHPDIK